MTYDKMVDWSLVDNELVLRVKNQCDTGAVLDSITSYTYNCDSVVRLVSTVFERLCGTDKVVVSDSVEWQSLLYYADKMVDDESFSRSFPCSREGRRVEYVSILSCWSRSSTRKAAELISRAFSCLGLDGYVYPVSRNALILVDDPTHFAIIRRVMAATDFDAVKLRIGVRRVQYFAGNKPFKPVAACVESPSVAQSFAQLVPETFTSDAGDISRVLVVSDPADVPSSRQFMGAFIDRSVVMDWAAGQPALYSAFVHKFGALKESDLRVYPVGFLRNLGVLMATFDVGYAMRLSWDKLVSDNEDVRGVLEYVVK